MTEAIKAFCCWSGGKESALSFYKLKKSGVNILCLVNMIDSSGKRSRSHGIIPDLLRLQSDAMGIAVIQRRTSWRNYENEFRKAITDLKSKGIKAGIFGDIDLQEHRDWVERVCSELDVEPVLPLWKEKREDLLGEFIGVGFKAIVVAVQSDFLGRKWLGRKIDERFMMDIKKLDIDICGEKGEYHTFVYDGPIFRKPVEFSTKRKILKNKHWFLDLAC